MREGVAVEAGGIEGDSQIMSISFISHTRFYAATAVVDACCNCEHLLIKMCVCMCVSLSVPWCAGIFLPLHAASATVHTKHQIAARCKWM